MTQEETAEQFNVSRRTVSRWETGSNLPDLDILIEMSDYYKVELRGLLDGERREDKMAIRNYWLKHISSEMKKIVYFYKMSFTVHACVQ